MSTRRRAHFFYNAIDQNEYHCRVLKQFLNTDVLLFPLAVFAKKPFLGKEGNKYAICSRKKMRWIIFLYMSTRYKIGQDELDKIYNRLSTLDHSEETKRLFNNNCGNLG